MKVRGVTSFYAREPYLSPVISQDIVGKTSSLSLSSLFPLSAIPHHSGSTLPSGIVLFVRGGCGGRRLFSHQSNGCDYTTSLGKGCNLSKRSWGGSKLSISSRYCSIPGFLRLFHRISGVKQSKVDSKHGGKCICQPYSESCPYYNSFFYKTHWLLHFI